MIERPINENILGISPKIKYEAGREKRGEMYERKDTSETSILAWAFVYIIYATIDENIAI